MKTLFSPKLMGIVVSSWQTSNITWHSVTRLNAICVLISSLQHLWPQENTGARWFSPSHSLSSSPGCACFLICSAAPFHVFSLSVPICSTSWGRVSREDSLQYASLLYLLTVILCRDRDRSAVTQIGRLPVPPHIPVQAPWDSGVRHASPLSF